MVRGAWVEAAVTGINLAVNVVPVCALMAFGFPEFGNVPTVWLGSALDVIVRFVVEHVQDDELVKPIDEIAKV